MDRSIDDIGEIINQCSESEDEGQSKWPGMTYEQGVKAALDWITGDSESNPMDG